MFSNVCQCIVECSVELCKGIVGIVPFHPSCFTQHLQFLLSFFAFRLYLQQYLPHSPCIKFLSVLRMPSVFEVNNTGFNTFQKRIPRVPRVFCSSLELKNFDQKLNGDGKHWSVYSKVCSHFHQRYSLFVTLVIRSIRKYIIRILIS